MFVVACCGDSNTEVTKATDGEQLRTTATTRFSSCDRSVSMSLAGTEKEWRFVVPLRAAGGRCTGAGTNAVADECVAEETHWNSE